MQHTHQRRTTRLLRPWPLFWTTVICVAAILIGSNTLSQFASGLVHGTVKPPVKAATAWPSFSAASPPTAVCGDKQLLDAGPRSAPARAVTVAAGDNSGVDFTQPGTTYWFAPGVHTLGSGEYSQIIPGDGASFIGAPGAVLDGQQVNDYAFGGSATNVTISYLTIENFGFWGDNQNQGVVNHDSSSGWTIDRSTITDNAGAGTMLGSDNTLSYNCLQNNQQYGFNAYAPSGISGLTIEHNEISGNDTYNWEAHEDGCGCTGGGKFWDVNGAVVEDNWIRDNHSVGLWADTNNHGFQFTGNYFSGNYSNGLIYEISYNAEISGNTFVRNGLGEGPKNPGFPTSAIYISESGGDSKVPGPFSGKLDITRNTFVNNWSGVILWENSNRFCNSPANTSSGYCTLVDPRQVTLKSCDAADISSQPYYTECRWKTQNVQVDHNTFDFEPAAIGDGCSAVTQCGFQGVFSEYGTYPSWSPYQGTSVEGHITFDQGNRFYANAYKGPWQFMIYQQNNVVSWITWRSAPYHQDAGSTASSQLP